MIFLKILTNFPGKKCVSKGIPFETHFLEAVFPVSASIISHFGYTFVTFYVFRENILKIFNFFFCLILYTFRAAAFCFAFGHTKKAPRRMPL